MKKVFILLSLALMPFTGAFAQYFAGGSINFSFNGGKTETGNTTTDKTKTTAFQIAPKGGIYLSEKLMVGAQVSYTINNTNNPTTDVTDRTSTIGIVPFARYYAFSFNKFSLYGQAAAGLSFSAEKTKTGSTTTNGPKYTTISLGVTPGVAYALNNHVELNASLNMLSFNFYRITEKLNGDKDITNYFGFGANSDNVVTLGNITVGFIYKF
ncbi:MAG: outer membrane beta-barrel protein [Bacteroidales bacterium]|nr:outer membrane beta-barrel protein [Bacteroidales bacterium]HPD95303.1 outer membrane beta-barrel protein [Tenuifilaceae bacterium]HRX30551.1 outer membrane beta-barrel protein [Tenuifilaceae bacterium]